MKKDQSKPSGKAAGDSKKKGPSPALKKARNEIEAKKKALKNANAKKRDAEAELAEMMRSRPLCFGASFGGGLAAGAITEGLRGSEWGEADPEGEGFFDSDVKAALVPAGVGLALALIGGGNKLADAAAMGMSATLASELGKAGVRKLREDDDE